MSTEYEQASVQRLDLILAHAQKQTETLQAIQSHTRGITAAIVFGIIICVLAVLLSVMR